MNSDNLKKGIGCVFMVIAFLIAVCGGVWIIVPSLFMQQPWLLLWLTVPFGLSLGLALVAYWLMKPSRGDEA